MFRVTPPFPHMLALFGGFVGTALILLAWAGVEGSAAAGAMPRPPFPQRLDYQPIDTPAPSVSPTPTPDPPCGLAWREVNAPSPGSHNYLGDVAAVSSGDVWAVGSSSNS